MYVHTQTHVYLYMRKIYVELIGLSTEFNNLYHFECNNSIVKKFIFEGSSKFPVLLIQWTSFLVGKSTFFIVMNLKRIRNEP